MGAAWLNLPEDTELTTPEYIITAARQAVGTRFVHQGRRLGVGLDCIGLVAHVATAIGAAHEDASAYGRRPQGGLLEAGLDAQPCLVRVREEIMPGDVLLMKFEGDASASHVGICCGATMVHAWAVMRKVCEHDIDDEWRRRIVRAYRFIGVDHGG